MENNKKEKLSFVIPCYRSEQTIESVAKEINDTVLSDGRYEYEMICVNDSSPDDTISVLNRMAEKDERITVVDLARNFGQHAAIMAGFNYVTGDIVVVMDDDGQTPPNEVFKIVDKLNEGYDMVSAKYPVKRESLFRRFGSWTSTVMGEILASKPKNVEINSYYAVRRFVVDEVIKYRNPYPNVQGLIFRVTRRITDTEINHRAREVGTSGYSITKLIALWMNSFTSFSEKPLRMASLLGVLSSACGFIFGIVIIIRKLLNPAVPLGYSSTMAVMLFMFGIVLLVLGLLGEYIGRMYICINNAPQFVVRDEKNAKKKTAASSENDGN
ncbi:MAG: glycosyltransferase family 2 protein [Firmicutes bacterium]|nr:glycosyltransferase family 2 protein [Bacillota bacterium]